MNKIKKILVANRGEIAVRIMRTCRELGIRTVAVYSDPDRMSLHVIHADEAYHIGAAESAQSYLNMNKILSVAAASGCDAIHPGYGFLSENSDFADACTAAGLIFIGPSGDTMRLMGSKTAARESMIAAGVPVVPGAKGAVTSAEQAVKIIENMGGFPILIKAAAGGGGKGMRVVRKQDELARSLNAARGEAAKAFGDETIYIEKFIEGPKHIEFQVFADTHGNAVHLWERDCSIQRRHQKLIEECPSSILGDKQRAEMGKIAVLAAKACNYVNAGTIEFLVDSSGEFYFLEMNTRLQVEHPVTEEVMGLDLVALQIHIAQGEPLPFSQEEVRPRGHAIECRLNAEDVFNNFVPTTGTLTRFKIPEGPGVRLDAGVAEGGEISRYYDPMFGKLIVHGADRKAAIARMLRALRECTLHGVNSTIPFCIAALQHEAFVSGRFTTKFVDLYWEEIKFSNRLDPETAITIAAAVRFHSDGAGALNSQEQYKQTSREKTKLSNWKRRALNAARSLK